MKLSIALELSYAVPQPCDLLLQVEAAATHGQQIVEATLSQDSAQPLRRIPAEEGIGERIWAHVETGFQCSYNAIVDITRATPDIAALPQTALMQLDGDVVKYLMPSRYCPLSAMDDLINAQFSGLEGGTFIAAARDWIEANFTYDNGVSNAFTTARETLNDRRGVCRDYAHVLITLARSLAIPARIASVYAPDVDPPDFHAVAEVFLDGAWHLVDATGMAAPDSIACIGVGRDAADVSFMTAYGFLDLQSQTVSVQRIP